MADNLEAIRKRLAAATPGPWEADGTEIYCALHNGVHYRKWIGETLRLDDPTAVADADLIAHTPTDLADLLALVDELTAERDELRRKVPKPDLGSPCEHW